jgi:hypothetical protein
MRNSTLSRLSGTRSSLRSQGRSCGTTSVLVVLSLLTAGALASCTPQNTGEFFEAFARVPEITARSVQVQVNHQARTICVAGILRNIGGHDITGPFKVAIGTTYVKNGITISKEQRVDVPATVTIAKNGGEYTTSCSTSELIYRDQVPGFVYNLEILADYENTIHEFDDWGNNRIKMDWWTLSPSAQLTAQR